MLDVAQKSYSNAFFSEYWAIPEKIQTGGVKNILF